jgi:hypothetical protein
MIERGSLAIVGMLACACSTSAPPATVAKDADVVVVGCPTVFDRASAGITAFGPTYGAFPDPAAPPLAWLAPGGDCLAIRVEAGLPGVLRVLLYADQASGWTATVSIDGGTDPVALTSNAGVLEGTVVTPIGASYITVTATKDSCAVTRVATLRRLGDLVAVVGYSASDCDGGGGPRSRRIYKTDIAYVDDAGRAALAKELMSLRLARYRYRGETPGTRRLGIILDDLAAGTPITIDHDSVDLYSYASLAIASAQQQQRELEELRARVRALEHRR